MKVLLLVALTGLGCSMGATYQGASGTQWAVRGSVLGITADEESFSTGDTSIGRSDQGLTPEQIEELVKAADLVGKLATRLGVPVP